MQYDTYQLAAILSHLEPLADEFENEGGWSSFKDEIQQAEAIFEHSHYPEYEGVAHVAIAVALLKTALSKLEALPADEDEDGDED